MPSLQRVGFSIFLARFSPICVGIAFLLWRQTGLDEDDATTRKAAFLVTALVHAPEMLEPVRRYYRALLDPLRSECGEVHEVRHALLAVEGIFLLRGLGFVEVSADEMKSVLLHARDIVIAVLAKHRAYTPHARKSARSNRRRSKT